jgi:hypothetical protein
MADHAKTSDKKTEGHIEAETPAVEPIIETVQVDVRASDSEHHANKADDEIQVVWQRQYVKGIRQWAPHVLGFLTLAVLAFQALLFSERSTWMREQSKATNDALIESRKSGEIETRAYVAVIEVVLDRPVRDSGEQVTALVKSMNTGRTPAVNFKSQVWSGTSPPTENSSLASPATTPGSQGILMPGRTWDIATTTQLGGQDKIAFSNTGSRLYCWGILEYDDFFGGHHTTRFCFVNESFTSVEFSPCPEGNSMN